MEMYQDARKDKMEEQLRTANHISWIQGQYNLAAIGAAMSRKVKYPDRPFAFAEKESGLCGEEQFKIWIDEYNRRLEDQERVP